MASSDPDQPERESVGELYDSIKPGHTVTRDYGGQTFWVTRWPDPAPEPVRSGNGAVALARIDTAITEALKADVPAHVLMMFIYNVFEREIGNVMP